MGKKLLKTKEGLEDLENKIKDEIMDESFFTYLKHIFLNFQKPANDLLKESDKHIESNMKYVKLIKELHDKIKIYEE